MERFIVGDTVRYSTTGVCRVAEVTKQQFGKTAEEYYVLQPVHKKELQVFVPCKNEQLVSKMKRLLSAAEVKALIAEMPQGDIAWEEDDQLRKTQYQQMLQNGSRKELIGMINAIYMHQKRLESSGKRLHQSDERFMEAAEKLLYDEFSYVLQIKPEEVLPFILRQLEPEEKKLEQ